jgi:hypothetical protein
VINITLKVTFGNVSQKTKSNNNDLNNIYGIYLLLAETDVGDGTGKKIFTIT